MMEQKKTKKQKNEVLQWRRRLPEVPGMYSLPEGRASDSCLLDTQSPSPAAVIRTSMQRATASSFCSFKFFFFLECTTNELQERAQRWSFCGFLVSCWWAPADYAAFFSFFFSLHVFSWLRLASLLCLQRIGWVRLSKCQRQSRWKKPQARGINKNSLPLVSDGVRIKARGEVRGKEEWPIRSK